MAEFAVRAAGLAKQFHLRHQQSYYRFTEFIENIARNAVQFPSRLLNQGLAGSERNQTPTAETFWALDDVSFQVKRGEVLGVIGRNGAGKSTLLKLLSRITRPTRGRIEIAGRVSSLLEVGTGFHPELTGRENIFLNGAMLGMTRTEVKRKFDEIVAFAETETFLDTQVKHYSSGMQMRLAFAVAAHLEPKILIIDEVLAVGDAAFQKKCLGRMGETVQSGRTILFVSHNLSAIRTLSHRVIWLENGRIRQEGPASEVVDKYLNDQPGLNRERTWSSWETSPGNERVRIRAVRIRTPEEGEMVITVQSEIFVEHELEVVGPIDEFNLSLLLYDREGICIFNAISPAEAVFPGRYRYTLCVPGDLLNDGSHRVRVLLVSSTRPVIDLWDVVEFDVCDAGRNSAWLGEWMGAVRPKLPWRCERV
jgi:lipopolysaccharide transport system ATP-binding protein